MRISLFLFLLATFLPAAGWSQERTVTLEEAIQIALDNNFQLAQAENNLGLAAGQVTSAYADFLPSLSGSLSGNQQVGRQFIQEELTFEDRTTYGISGNLNASIPIFTGFQNINNLRQARAGHIQERVGNERIREDIIFQTATRYLQVLLDQELLDIARQNLETSRMQLNQVDAQVDVGTRPIVDLYQQQSTVASNEVQEVQAENALNLSRTRLIRILQIDPLEDLSLVTPEFEDLDLTPQQLDMEELINYALANRADVEVQRLNIEMSRYALNIARGNYLPSLSASASISTRYSDQYRAPDMQGLVKGVGFGDQFFDQMITRSAGLSLSIPIFNNFSARTNVQQARVQQRNAQLAFEDLQYEIREEISQVYHDYLSLAKELEATERSLQAAERAYETQQQRYEIGSTSLIELNQATTEYMQAQSERQRVVYNFTFQEKLMDYYLGRITEDISL